MGPCEPLEVVSFVALYRLRKMRATPLNCIHILLRIFVLIHTATPTNNTLRRLFLFSRHWILPYLLLYYSVLSLGQFSPWKIRRGTIRRGTIRRCAKSFMDSTQLHEAKPLVNYNFCFIPIPSQVFENVIIVFPILNFADKLQNTC